MEQTPARHIQQALDDAEAFLATGNPFAAMQAIAPYKDLYPALYEEIAQRFAADEEATILQAAAQVITQLLQAAAPAILPPASAEVSPPTGRYRVLMCTTCETEQKFHGSHAHRTGGRWHCVSCGFPE